MTDSPAPTEKNSPPQTPIATREDSLWRDYFDRAAREKPRFSVGQSYLRRDVSQALQRLIPADARVLEAGCGLAGTLSSLSNTHKKGLDITPAAVFAAREKHPTLDITHADALTWRSDQRFDAIICDRLIHTVSDIQLLLSNLAQHLSPNGRIFLTCYNYLWELAIKLGERSGFKLPTPPGNWLSESDLQNLFELSGLEVVKYEDRMLLPAPLPGLSTLVNRYVSKLPVIDRFSMYRLYALRRRPETLAPRPAPKVTVVVPARNEAGNVPNIISRTPVMGSGTELVFVEGGSTDDTQTAIDTALQNYSGPLELKSFKQTGKGKGDAVRVGFANATGDLLMILDADLTVPPEELPKFYDVMVQGKTDYVQGTRLVYPMESEAMRFLNKLGNIGFSKLFSFMLNQPLKDTLCGTKVLWRDDYSRLAANRAYFGDFDPFGDFDLIFGASKLNLKILEIPIRYRDRTYGTTNISRFRHGLMLLEMSAVAARKLKFV